MAINAIIYFLAYFFITIFSIASILFLISIIWMIRKTERHRNFKFSVILKYYFWMLLVLSILMCIHAVTVLCIWRNDLNLPFTLFFWTGTMDASLMPGIPFITFILTLDRCLILLFKRKHNRFWTMFLFYVNILITLTIAGIISVMNILFHHPELPDNCISYGCIVTYYAQLAYTYTRTIGVILCAIVGILFFVMVSWLKKQESEIATTLKTITEAVVLRAVIFELICDFLPHIIDGIIISTTGDTPFKYIGPFSRIIMIVDILLNSMINWLVFFRDRRQSNALVAKHTTMS